MATALVGLGSNQGDRHAALTAAIAALARLGESAAFGASRFHETTSVGGPAGQPAFLNAAVRLETTLEPLALLRELQVIENTLGRLRVERWGPRTVDLDLLLYDQVTLESQELTLPHPRMSFRRFVLEPAAEVAGDLLHPTIGWTVWRLLEHLNTAKPYVAVLATSPELVHGLAAAFAGRVVSLDWGGYVRSDWDQQGRMVRAFAASLNDAHWPTDGKLVVSDCRADNFVWRRFTGRDDSDTAAAIDTAAAPKLTLAWAANSAIEKHTADTSEPFAENPLRTSQLQSFARFPGRGPICYLDVPSVAAALSEAIAAVRAME